jgi:hypothetical protein
MQIQASASPLTLRFDFASESQRRALLGRLAKGQALEARVLDQLPEGRWAIRVMGHTLVAESRLSLMPGQIVEARVESLGPPLVLSLAGQSRSTDAVLSRALTDLGLADDTVNRTVIKGLIAQGLLVNRREVQTLRDLLLGLGAAIDLEDADALEALVSRALFLRSQGLPATPDTLGAYLAHLPAGALGGLMEGLVDLLRSLRLPGPPKAHLAALADRIQTVLQNAGALTGDALKGLLNDLGLDLEGRMATWIAAAGEGLPGGIEDALKPALLSLQAHLAALNLGTLDGAGRSTLDALQGRIHNTLQLLDTLQAANLPTPTRDALHLQIPFLLNGRSTTADLRVSCRENNGRQSIDPDNLHLSLAVDLSSLGPVRIDLSVLQKRASCRIHAADEQKAAFLRDAADELKGALEKCGYSVADVACRVTLQEKPDDLSQTPPTIGVDLRV